MREKSPEEYQGQYQGQSPKLAVDESHWNIWVGCPHNSWLAPLLALGASAMLVMSAAHFLAHGTDTMWVVVAPHLLTVWANTMVVMLAAHFLAHGAHALAPVPTTHLHLVFAGLGHSRFLCI